jgi:8-oxo-dGTP pyrophosphatase MutT (NUDIX family)
MMPVAEGAVRIKHATSSVFVLRRDGGRWQLGLIRHPRFRRAMIPGGHVEAGESPAEAALREVAEETGLHASLLWPPAVSLPAGYRPPRVAPPWWIVEYEVPADGHLGSPHIHIDHLYLALPDDSERPGPPAHPFAWHGAAELAALPMFDDARALLVALLSVLGGIRSGPAGELPPPGALAAAIAAGLGPCAQAWGQSARTEPIVSASDAGLSGRWRSTRAKRSASPPG